MEPGWQAQLTEVRLPPSVALPVQIVKLLVPSNGAIDRAVPILSFTATINTDSGPSIPTERIASDEAVVDFASPYKGKVVAWLVKPGDIISHRQYVHVDRSLNLITFAERNSKDKALRLSKKFAYTRSNSADCVPYAAKIRHCRLY